VGSATTAVDAIPDPASREAARSVLAIVSSFDDEPSPLCTAADYALPADGGDPWRAVICQAAVAAGRLSTAEDIAGRLFDQNLQAYMRVMIAQAALTAGDTERAATIAGSVRTLAARVDRPVRSRALAVAVGAVATHHPDRARSLLAAGLVDSFSSELFVLAQQLDDRTVGQLMDELGVDFH
jgi:hypothetical protein